MEILVIASPVRKWKQYFKRTPRSHFCVTVDRKFHVAEKILCHLAYENHIPNNVELHWVWSWSCWSCSSGISSFTRFNQKRIIKNFRIETNTRFIIQRRRQDFLAKFMRVNPNIGDIDLGDNPLTDMEMQKFSSNIMTGN